METDFFNLGLLTLVNIYIDIGQKKTYVVHCKIYIWHWQTYIGQLTMNNKKNYIGHFQSNIWHGELYNVNKFDNHTNVQSGSQSASI